MSSRPAGLMRSVWYRWKSQKWVPWRKRYLIGLDLQGNTFWEFRESLWARQNRMRRIVLYPSHTHPSDVDVLPQWLQWLRHTRADPPSLTEQREDVVRQENLKLLAAQADARWAAKPSVLDAPGREGGQPVPALGSTARGEGEGLQKKRDIGRDGAQSYPQGTAESTADSPGINAESASIPRTTKNTTTIGSEIKKKDEDPWKQARSTPSGQFQPSSWSGNATPKNDR